MPDKFLNYRLAGLTIRLWYHKYHRRHERGRLEINFYFPQQPCTFSSIGHSGLRLKPLSRTHGVNAESKLPRISRTYSHTGYTKRLFDICVQNCFCKRKPKANARLVFPQKSLDNLGALVPCEKKCYFVKIRLQLPNYCHYN